MNLNLSDKTMKQFMSSYYQLDNSTISRMCIDANGIPEANRDLFSQRHAPSSVGSLSVSDFRTKLLEISEEQGKGSRERVFNHVASLWNQLSSPEEVYFSSRCFLILLCSALLMLRNRGLGFGTQLIKRALIHHFGLDSSSVDYQALFHHRPQFDSFIDFLQNPTSSYPVIPGQFCSCALCSPLSSLEEASSVLSSSQCVIEWKYDGIRIQVHRHNHSFTVFGRSGEVGLKICCEHRSFLPYSLQLKESCSNMSNLYHFRRSSFLMENWLW